jgi:hypothetical protein
MMTSYMDSILFQPRYFLALASQGSNVVDYVVRSNDQWLRLVGYKIRVPGCDSSYVLESPYGSYGFTTNATRADICDLIVKLKAMLRSDAVIAAFVRIHPFQFDLFSDQSVVDYYPPVKKLVLIGLSGSYEERWHQYSPTTRNILRRTVPGMSTSDSVCPHAAYKLYSDAMKHKRADDSFLLSKLQFIELLNDTSTRLVGITIFNELVAFSMIVVDEQLSYYHFAAMSVERSKTNNIGYHLIEESVKYVIGVQPTCPWLHLGGGLSANETDSLYTFKKKFSDHVMPYQPIGIISDKPRYDSLRDDLLEDDTKYFLRFN